MFAISHYNGIEIGTISSQKYSLVSLLQKVTRYVHYGVPLDTILCTEMPTSQVGVEIQDFNIFLTVFHLKWTKIGPNRATLRNS